MIELPEPLDKRPEAGFEVNVARERARELGGAVVRGREVLEDVEEEAVLVVEGDGGVDYALMEVAELLVCGWWVDLAP
jgi:hypothetical protein